MSRFLVLRTGDVPLNFTGTCLVEVDSKWRGDQERWTEIRIYRTDTGKYVTEMVGRSTKRRETDRRKVVVHDSTDTIRAALSREGPEGRYLTDLALSALVAAAQQDPALSALLTERI